MTPPNTPRKDEVREIAAKLTKAQREAVERAPEFACGWSTVRSLKFAGLVSIRTCFPDGRGLSLTPLGIAVRKYLESSNA